MHAMTSVWPVHPAVARCKGGGFVAAVTAIVAGPLSVRPVAGFGVSELVSGKRKLRCGMLLRSTTWRFAAAGSMHTTLPGPRTSTHACWRAVAGPLAHASV